MEELHADALLIEKDAESLRTADGKIDSLAWHRTFFFDWEPTMDGIKIMPEETLLNRHGEVGESLDGEIEGHL